MTPLVAGRRVVKRFGPLTAVAGVDLEVSAGEVVGLLGANGAGKTTLIRVLLGLTAADSGEAALLGEPPSRSTLRRVGYVPQGLGLYTDLTVAENLAFRAGLFAVAPAPLGVLEPLSDTVVGRLPLGLQRRVAFAAALQHGPRLLVLDEPTSGVGQLSRAELWDTIRRSSDAGVGVLVTTHHLEEAEQCDRLLMMAAGHIVAAGSVGDVVGGLRAVEVTTPRWPQALAVLEGDGFAVSLAGRRLRIPGGDEGAVQRALASAGIAASVATRPATLEEAFVALAS